MHEIDDIISCLASNPIDYLGYHTSYNGRISYLLNRKQTYVHMSRHGCIHVYVHYVNISGADPGFLEEDINPSRGVRFQWFT